MSALLLCISQQDEVAGGLSKKSISMSEMARAEAEIVRDPAKSKQDRTF